MTSNNLDPQGRAWLKEIIRKLDVERIAALLSMAVITSQFAAYLASIITLQQFLSGFGAVIVFSVPLFVSLKRKGGELSKYKEEIYILFKSVRGLDNLRGKLKEVCIKLGWDICTVYTFDRDGRDLVLLFEHGTKREFMQGLTRRQEVSHQVWVTGKPWFAKYPTTNTKSKDSSFREREKIKSAIAYPISMATTFGIIFINFTTNKNKGGELRHIKRWRKSVNAPRPEFAALIEKVVDHLTFHISLHRNLIESPTILARDLTYFEKLIDGYIALKREDSDYTHSTSPFVDHILAAITSGERFKCGLYLSVDETLSDSKVKYLLTESDGDPTISSDFRSSYELNTSEQGPLEFLERYGGYAPLVFSPADTNLSLPIKLEHLFSHVDNKNYFMIFPIHGLDCCQCSESGMKKVDKTKDIKPIGFIAVITPSTFRPFEDHSPIVFGLVAEYIGIIDSSLQNLPQNDIVEFWDNLKGLKKAFTQPGENWMLKINKVLDLAIQYGHSDYVDVWAFSRNSNQFYLVAQQSADGTDAIDHHVWEPRPNDNSKHIVESGQNRLWKSVTNQPSLVLAKESGVDINSLMGFPLEGVMQIYSVVWVRFKQSMTETEFRKRAILLRILFEFSGQILSMSRPADEIHEMIESILEGNLWIKNPIPLRALGEKWQNFNEAILLIKPPNNIKRELLKEIFRTLTNTGCEIHGLRVFTGEELSNGDLIEKHLGRAFNIASGKEKLTETDYLNIAKIYDKDVVRFINKWGIPPSQMRVIPSNKLSSKTKEDLTDIWNNGRLPDRFHKEVFNGLNKIGPKRSVMPAKIRGENDDRPFFILNGYLPGLKAIYTKPSARTIAVLVRWQDSSECTWRILIEDVVGDSNDPDECSERSIRWRAKNHHHFPLQHQNFINGQKNVVHMSSGPLEAMRELQIWFGIKYEATILGRSLLLKSRKIKPRLLCKIADPIYEQFVEQRKISTKEVMKPVSKLVFWLQNEAQVLRIWPECHSIISVLESPQRRFILDLYHFWELQHLLLVAEDTESLAKSIIEIAREHLFESDAINIKLIFSDEVKNNLKECIKKLLERNPVTRTNNNIEDTVLKFYLAISLWISDRIEMNSISMGPGILSEMEVSLVERIVDLSERLFQYSKPNYYTQIRSENKEQILSSDTEYLNQKRNLKNLKVEAANNLLAIVLAAGRGTRAMTTISKPMLSLNNATPIIDPIIQTLRTSGFSDIRVATKKNDTPLFLYLSSEHQQVHIIEMGNCKGVGFRMAIILNMIKGYSGRVLICYADMPFINNQTIENMIHKLDTPGVEMVISVADNPRLSGHIELDDESDDFVKAVLQARFKKENRRSLQDAGTYLFQNNANILSALENVTCDGRGDYIFSEIVNQLYVRGLKIGLTTISEEKEALGIDTPRDLINARYLYANNGHHTDVAIDEDFGGPAALKNAKFHTQFQ